MAARASEQASARMSVVGAQSGGSLEELQQFRNCFPFFCSLNCFPRSTVLSEASPRHPAGPIGPLSSPVVGPRALSLDAREREEERKKASPRLYGELFVIIAFPPTSSGNGGRVGRRKKHPPLERTE